MNRLVLSFVLNIEKQSVFLISGESEIEFGGGASEISAPHGAEAKTAEFKLSGPNTNSSVCWGSLLHMFTTKQLQRL